MVRLMRHRQTKGPDSARAHLNRRAPLDFTSTSDFFRLASHGHVRTMSQIAIFRQLRNCSTAQTDIGPVHDAFISALVRIATNGLHFR